MTLENERIRLGVGGPEMIRLAEDIGTLAVRVAEAKGGERLKAETDHYVKGQISRMRVACGACASRMVKDAAADALRAEPIERPAWDRRSDFLLRLVMAFYPHGLVTERKDDELRKERQKADKRIRTLETAAANLRAHKPAGATACERMTDIDDAFVAQLRSVQ